MDLEQVFEYAIDQEIKTREFYERSVVQTDNVEASALFRGLARMEGTHRSAPDQMLNSIDADGAMGFSQYDHYVTMNSASSDLSVHRLTFAPGFLPIGLNGDTWYDSHVLEKTPSSLTFRVPKERATQRPDTIAEQEKVIVAPACIAATLVIRLDLSFNTGRCLFGTY